MDYGTDSAIVLSNFAAKETGRIAGSIRQALAQRSCWTNVLKGGVFPTGMGDTLRSVVQLPAYTAVSYANPTLTDYTAICGVRGNQSKVSTVEYTTKLQTLRGRGPDVCVNQGYGAFEGWLMQATKSMKDDIVVIRDSIDRAAAWKMSATKYTAVSTVGFSARIAGGTEADVGVAPITTAADSQISFAELHELAVYVKEVLFADPYTLKVAETGGNDQFSVFLGSQQVINAFRRETSVQTSLNALTTGGFKYGQAAISGMNFQTAGAWQGIAMKADQFPLRFTTHTSGVPTFIEPFVEVVDNAGDNRSHKKVNPLWVAATFEIGFLLHNDTFERLTPEKYTGEGEAKFDPRLSTGELMWTYRPDNMTNEFGDFGYHRWELTQAYRAIRPHHLVAVIYKRCAANDLVPCT